MGKKVITNGIFLLFLFLICCGVAWGQTGSGNPNDPLPVAKTQTISEGPELPDGIQTYYTHGDPLMGGNQEFESATTTKTNYIPLWRMLGEMTSQDRSNAQIQIETHETLPVSTVQKIKNVENLWNSAQYNAAITVLKSLEQEGVKDLAVGVCWKAPKLLSGPLDWGVDVQVETRGDTQETCMDFHDSTGNIFAHTRRNTTASDNSCWTINISTNGGATWSETYFWWSSIASCIDTSASVVGDYVYIGYVTGSNTSDAHLRRVFASDGSVDSAYGNKTVFDTGVDIKEISLTSNAPNANNYIYYSAILADNTIELYNITSTGGMNKYTTGIIDAAMYLDSCWNTDYPSNNYLTLCYRNTSNRLIAVMCSSYSSFAFKDVDDCDGDACICAYDDHILVAFEFNTTTPYTGKGIKYWISYNGGGSWAYGFVASPAANSEYFHSPDATGRKNGGIAVVYQEEAGSMDPCWFRHRPYATASWTTPVTYNENDVYTGSDMSVEWVPSGGANYGSLWFVYNTSPFAYYDRSDWTAVTSLVASPASISAKAGGTVKFKLDAGPKYGGKKYILLGSVTGTSPGTKLPGGGTLPLNWDFFTNLTVVLANSPIFQNTLGKLDKNGQASAAMVTKSLPPTAVGLTLYFAFPARAKPKWFASNAVKILIIP